MIANTDNYALFNGVPDYCEIHGNSIGVSALSIGLSLSILNDVEKALDALKQVYKFESFDTSPKIVFNLSAIDQSFTGFEVVLLNGSNLEAENIQLIATSNGYCSCLVLAFVDSITNTSRWEILLSRID
ncbi:hypothetical protein GHT89_16315 [Acinetobacter baumannii]